MGVQVSMLKERRRLEIQDPSDRFGSVAKAGSSLQDGPFAFLERVNFGGMVAAPLLTFQTDPVLEDENTLAVQAVDHGFGQLGTGRQNAHPGYGFQLPGKGCSGMFKSLQRIQSLEVRGGGLLSGKDVHGLKLQFLDAIRGRGILGETLNQRSGCRNQDEKHRQ